MKTGNCRCEGCKQMFYFIAAFEAHRVGDFAGGPWGTTRRCLTPAEMQLKGMALSPGGVWNSGKFTRMATRLAS